MSVAIRVIPCLDVDAGRVVKGVNFEGLRDAGDPVELAHRYDRAGADELTKKGAGDRHALRIGIRCERASHRFFKRYGERFEDSEGKRIFLEFADEERDHCDLLVREYRSLLERQRRRGPAKRRPRSA